MIKITIFKTERILRTCYVSVKQTLNMQFLSFFQFQNTDKMKKYSIKIIGL